MTLGGNVYRLAVSIIGKGWPTRVWRARAHEVQNECRQLTAVTTYEQVLALTKMACRVPINTLPPAQGQHAQAMHAANVCTCVCLMRQHHLEALH